MRNIVILVKLCEIVRKLSILCMVIIIIEIIIIIREIRKNQWRGKFYFEN